MNRKNHTGKSNATLGRLAVLAIVSTLFTANVCAAKLELILERSVDLREWERVPIGSGNTSVDGTVLVPADASAGFYRLRMGRYESAGMVLVQGGTLSTSNALSGTVVSTFFIGRHEVTWGDWQAVRAPAAANGYDIGAVGEGCADDHPVHSVNWFDVLKWCNLKSELDGLTPVYTEGGGVYKTGQPDHTTISQNLSANGYRLPMDAEWEFAARGGNQTNGYVYSGSNDLNAVGWYQDNSGGSACDMSAGHGTWPVGQKAFNELGLYDMSGNVWEWCWDQSGTIPIRRIRGGSWNGVADYCPVSARFLSYPDGRWNDFGFRLARTASP
jgi:formylglycine-generating enzyme